MDDQQVIELIRAMSKSPEGTLLAREALTRAANTGDPIVDAQLSASESALRQWIAPAQWVLVKGEPHAGQTLTYAGMDANGTTYFFIDERGDTLTLLRK